MTMAMRWLRVPLVVTLLLVQLSLAITAPLSVTPSINWYGYDGSWSAISLRVGMPQQWVDVMVNTVSSETWVVGPGGCPGNNSLCTSARGAIFDLAASSTWQDQSFYNLGVDARFGGSAYAEYGLDDIKFGSTGITLDNTIIGSINATEYWLGMFGLGVIPGNFKNVTSLPAISGLVEKNSALPIPSHSYGYTAGAKYQQKGVPNSLTLGGIDGNRFQPHNTTFTLNPTKNPQASINSISVISSAKNNNWTTEIQLASTADRVSAIIDSSTPYLWLPQSICDRFARTLGLSYNSSLKIYTYDINPTQHDTLMNSQLSFTFSLSDLSVSPELVNITLPYAAFDLQLTFPSPLLNATYGAADSTKYYFPLKVALNEAQYTIGRAFLQEAYIITDYERNTFSVHQAVHTSDPIGNRSIQAISRPGDSTFTPPQATKKSKSKLSSGAIAGIVIGVIVGIALLLLLAFCLRRRKQKQKSPESIDEKPIVVDQSHSLFNRFRKKHPTATVSEAAGSTVYATEVGADASHERFELPASMPAELDSEAGTLSGTTEYGHSTQASNNSISAYERARRKHERQMAGIYPAPLSQDEYPVEKSEHDGPTNVPHRHLEVPASEGNTPLVSPVGDSHTISTLSDQPSPISPGFASGPTSPISPPPNYRRIAPGNVVYAGPLPDNVTLPQLVPEVIGPGRRSRPSQQTLLTEPGTMSDSEGMSSTLGSQFTENEDLGTDLYNNTDPIRQPHSPVSSNSPGGSAIGTGNQSVSAATLSSNHTHLPTPSEIRNHNGPGQDGRIIREKDESKFLMEDMVALRKDMQAREVLNPYQGRTRVHGEDLVHVPVVAAERFSFEEERIGEGSGTR